jgi:hypothetical protein
MTVTVDTTAGTTGEGNDLVGQNIVAEEEWKNVDIIPW